MSKAEAPLHVVVDTREQMPFEFTRYAVEVVRAGLATGDYSLPGFEDRAAVERKSVDDLLGCLTVGRDRFERELARLRHYELAAVVVEASWEDLARARYRSRMEPQAALQSILAFQVRYRVPFILPGSREAAEYVTHGLLSKFLREVEQRYRQATKGQAA